MTRYHLRFAPDESHPEQTFDYDRADGSFVFWLAETKEGREFSISADQQPVGRLQRSRTNADFWILRKP